MRSIDGRRWRRAGLILGLFLYCRSATATAPAGPGEGQERRPGLAEGSPDSLRVAAGFRVELVASEPLVLDPIAFEWGADGRLWVVEMGDYPLGLDNKGAPGGCVKILDDLDGDGRYDRSTLFLGGLGFPTGLMPWRDGVLISRAPDILYAEDRDGDGRADHVEVLFTGFVPGSPQHRVNGFDLGLDGLDYGANGDSGGSIRSPGRDLDPISIRGRDFRFDPVGVVLAEEALGRNPAYSPASPQRRLDPDARLFPDRRTAPRFNSPNSANQVTSANSPNGWRRDTAQRLLAHRRDPLAIGPLRLLSLTLLRAEGREDVLLRPEIEVVSASGRSLMPEGIEEEVSPRELAGLLAYLDALRSPAKDEARPR